MRIILSVVLSVGIVFGAGEFAIHELNTAFNQSSQPTTVARHLIGGPPIPWTVGARVVRVYKGYCWHGNDCLTCVVYEKHGVKRTYCHAGSW